ncbi:type IV toxin-antitoxin system AbiEi family antitoxin [Micromonospora sp. NPDC049679]|uniref:type IV toxin-antitoxin system AbiEi family antitoxin n=1 Tax=Micromonospora sp. NPDC049679 TaxID=3155920 RepID=UPI0033EC2728
MADFPFPPIPVPMPNELLGLDRVRAGVRRRAFVSVAHNLWVPAEEAPADTAEWLRMLMTATPGASAASHETAVWWYGLPPHRDHNPRRPHVTVPPGYWLQRKDFVIHVAALPPDDYWNVRALMVTSPARTFLDIARAGDRERLVIVGDAMLRARLVTPEVLRERVAAAQRARGVRIARELLPFLTDAAQSPPESILRLRFHAAGLPPAVPQCPVELDNYIAHADLGWPEARVALEYEGRQHAARDQFLRDIDRYSAFAARGWLLLRAGSSDLSGGSRVLIDRVGAALRSRGLSW